ncbi:response regulator transcription factor [Paraburkholderia strydomiana]|uniref:Response regulator n=1 Tax=Paraburkholderia strydomiana TaxID=1245417 RepID=A0ABW9CC65_9BURK
MTEATSIVFVVDDDDAVRRALTRLIRSAGYCVESFGSANAFLEFRPYSGGCACLVLDVVLPGVNGLELQNELNAANSSLPIIFISGHGDIGMTVRAMKAGATDFLAKPVSDSDLLCAIENALRHSSRALSRRAELDRIHGRMARLTPREREVLTLLVEGRLNKQVACELGIAEKTIKVHRARVMEKMEASSLVDLVRAIDKADIPLSPAPSDSR